MNFLDYVDLVAFVLNNRQRGNTSLALNAAMESDKDVYYFVGTSNEERILNDMVGKDSNITFLHPNKLKSLRGKPSKPMIFDASFVAMLCQDAYRETQNLKNKVKSLEHRLVNQQVETEKYKTLYELYKKLHQDTEINDDIRSVGLTD